MLLREEVGAVLVAEVEATDTLDIPLQDPTGTADTVTVGLQLDPTLTMSIDTAIVTCGEALVHLSSFLEVLIITRRLWVLQSHIMPAHSEEFSYAAACAVALAFLHWLQDAFREMFLWMTTITIKGLF